MTAPVASDGRAIHVLRVIEAIRLEVGRYFVSFDRISQTVLVAASFLMLAAVEGHLVEPIFLGAASI
jgi:hypothetical protein